MRRFAIGGLSVLGLAVLLVCAACSDERLSTGNGNGWTNGTDAAEQQASSGAGGDKPQGQTPGSTPTGQADTPKPVADSPAQPETKHPSAPPRTEDVAQAAVEALKTKNMSKLAELAHPERGVRFSPYGHVDVAKDRVFKPEALGKLWTDNTVYQWGAFDGSGEPFELKFADYYAKFVYDADFAKPEQSAINQTIGKGNTANNLSEAYSANKHDVVEYHFSGFDPKLEGMDWKSLRLVFEKDGSRLYLVGVVHDQWTI